MQLTYQKLKPFALSYLTAPLAVFFAGYLRAPFAVAGLAVLAFAWWYAVCKTPQVKQVGQEEQGITLSVPKLVLLFALLSLLVLLLDGWTGGVSTTRFFCVYRSSLADPLTYVRFFGHVLGHSGYSHYMNNMLLLLLVGPGLEEKYGSRNLLVTILVTALVTGLVQFIFFPGTALLGASGVVFMMIVLNSFTEMRRGGIPLTMLLVVALYLGNEVVDGLSESDNISQMTHIVGGLCGIVFGFTLARAKKR